MSSAFLFFFQKALTVGHFYTRGTEIQQIQPVLMYGGLLKKLSKKVPRVSYLKVIQQQSKTQELSSVFLIRWTGFGATDNSSRFWLAEHILDPADDREGYVDLDFPIDIDSGWRNISLPQRMIEKGM